MKHFALFSSLLGALCLAAPVTGWSDGHHWSGGGGGVHFAGGFHAPPCGARVGGGFHHYPYCGYPYFYGYYPGYAYYGPTVAYSYTTDPGYGSYYSDRADSQQPDGANELAMDVQRALAKRGFYNGAIDGDVGPATRGAIREFQYKNHLEVTGRIDRTLLRSLGVD
jgi:hypothetical protein